MIPVLWICGAPGVGKSTVAWSLYQQLGADGVACGYVDIDQLGMCYPEHRSDPGRYRLKAENLCVLVAGFEAAGSGGLVVSGILDAAGGSEFEYLPRQSVTLCQLRAEPDQLRDRLSKRRGSSVAVEDALADAELLDSIDVADLVVETSRLGVPQVVGEVRRLVGSWPGRDDPLDRAVAHLPLGTGERAEGSVWWLCGPTGVGKSTVGFRLYQRMLGTGITAAYVDVEQIGFCSTAPRDHRLRSRNLAALWQTFRSAGAEVLVAVGPVADRTEAATYEHALAGAHFTWIRLHAGETELTSRILSRQQGGSWPQPGDPMRGQSAARLSELAEQAIEEAGALERSGVGLRVDTDGRSVDELAESIWSRHR